MGGVQFGMSETQHNGGGDGGARADIAQAAAAAIERASGELTGVRALVGFDGFLDEIIRVVSTRRSMADDDFEAIATIPEFAARCGAAAGKSANIELSVREQRFGGNGPLMAGGVARLGMPTTYCGAIGRSADEPGVVHPLWQDFAARCERVIPVGPPAHTDALEFDDGKIMLGKPRAVQDVTWELLKRTIGLEEIRRLIERSTLVGIVNWTLCGGVEGIWHGLIDEVFPALKPLVGGRTRRVFIDLSDPAKRTDEDIARAVGVLRKMDALVPVTLGLNLSEAERLAHVLGVAAFGDEHNTSLARAVRDGAAAIREASGLSCVVVHPRQGAGAATATEREWFEGPFTRSPRLSTGAGDHFNAGFAFAQSLNLPLSQCLAVGVGVSGAYVRDAASPDLARLQGVLRDLPVPE
ncbi:MAG: carbohydrate kinase family protein [Phycisphaerales bacterium]|nr:MAG: carbohydrate kinase family protein [Phycisphaerales bacterium]